MDNMFIYCTIHLHNSHQSSKQNITIYIHIIKITNRRFDLIIHYLEEHPWMNRTRSSCRMMEYALPVHKDKVRVSEKNKASPKNQPWINLKNLNIQWTRVEEAADFQPVAQHQQFLHPQNIDSVLWQRYWMPKLLIFFLILRTRNSDRRENGVHTNKKCLLKATQLGDIAPNVPKKFNFQSRNETGCSHNKG